LRLTRTVTVVPAAVVSFAPLERTAVPRAIVAPGTTW
jgi:hypothetical protein